MATWWRADALFGAITQRTCPNCTIDGTVWWKLVAEGRALDELSDDERAVIDRTCREPDSILVED